MRRLVAWRILTHEKGRSALAIAGIFVAVLMILLQLGFYASVPAGGMQVYDKMSFDILLTSSAYNFEAQSFDFPRRRLYQAASVPGVVAVAPLYQGIAPWLNGPGGRRDVYVMGFNLDDHVFNVPDIEARRDILARPDMVLVDRQTRPSFGPLTPGRHIEINDRDVTIAGLYTLGTGFVGLGAVTTSDLNFIRIFPTRTLGEPNLGLVTLRPGADPDRVAAALRALLPADTRVFTRDALAKHEMAHWVTTTSTGLIFGFGTIISIVVGTVILYQTLATQIIHHLPQYATLKAIGYHDRYLGGIVMVLVLIMAMVAFVPAVVAAFGVYRLVRDMTLLPIAMTAERLVGVLALTVAMSLGSALLSIRKVSRADPVDLF